MNNRKKQVLIERIAHYYNKCAIWTFPYPEILTIDWRHLSDKDFLEKVSTYNWEKGKFLMVIIGKKGLRALQINLKYKKSIPTILSLLRLPTDYKWVYKDTDYTIIFDSPDIVMTGNGVKSNYCKFIWEGTLGIPYEEPNYDSYNSFVNHSFPNEHPAQISNDILRDCIKHLRKDKFWKQFDEGNDKEEYKKELGKWIHEPETKKVGCGCGTFILMMIICIILGVGSDEKLDVGSLIIGIICFVALFIIGAYFTGAFDD